MTVLASHNNGHRAPSFRYIGMPKEDRRWLELQWRTGWSLPQKAAWPYRLPGVRHLRAAYYLALCGQPVRLKDEPKMPDRDYWVAYAIQRGWC